MLHQILFMPPFLIGSLLPTLREQEQIISDNLLVIIYTIPTHRLE